MDYGLDISIFANGLPDTRSAGAQRLSSRPALDLTLSTISDRDVLILDLYKLQFTPPELVFWSQDQNGEPAPITINLPDLLQDTVGDRAGDWIRHRVGLLRPWPQCSRLPDA